jgi:hypothetical protein
LKPPPPPLAEEPLQEARLFIIPKRGQKTFILKFHLFECLFKLFNLFILAARLVGLLLQQSRDIVDFLILIARIAGIE